MYSSHAGAGRESRGKGKEEGKDRGIEGEYERERERVGGGGETEERWECLVQLIQIPQWVCFVVTGILKTVEIDRVLEEKRLWLVQPC